MFSLTLALLFVLILLTVPLILFPERWPKVFLFLGDSFLALWSVSLALFRVLFVGILCPDMAYCLLVGDFYGSWLLFRFFSGNLPLGFAIFVAIVYQTSILLFFFSL